MLDPYPFKRYNVEDDGYDSKTLVGAIDRLASPWGKLVPADYLSVGPPDAVGHATAIGDLNKRLDTAHRGVTGGRLGKDGKAVVAFSGDEVCAVMNASVVGWWRLFHHNKEKADKKKKVRALFVAMLNVIGQEKYNRRHDLALPLVWKLRVDVLQCLHGVDEEFVFHDGFEEQPSSTLQLPMGRAEDGHDVQMLCKSDRTLQEKDEIMNGFVDSVVKLVDLTNRRGDALPTRLKEALCQLMEVGGGRSFSF